MKHARKFGLHLVAISLALLAIAPPTIARELTVGTLAYSLIAEGFPNIYVQGSINDKSAWFVDKCSDNSNTVVGLYKHYRHRVSSGPYWFGGLIYIAQGTRAGTSATLGFGYEHSTKNNLVLGAYVGGAAGGNNNQTYGVANITVGYIFK